METKIRRKTMKQVRARRERLRTVMDRLEAALGAPLPKRQRAWLKGVRAAFDEVAAAVGDHIAGVEADNGLFAQVRADAPRLVGMIRRLENEHADLADTVQVLGQRLAAVEPAANVDGVRRDLLHLLGLLTHHRQLGTDLLYEAYVVDVSVGD